MTVILWILLILSGVMYLEGLVIAAFAGAMSQPSKFVWPLLLIFWPVALPLMAYKTYRKYKPVIQQVMENPLLGSLMGFNAPQENPIMGLLGQTAEPLFPANEGKNPFLADLFTEAEPSGELAELMERAKQTEQTTETPESNDSEQTTDSEESDTKGDQTQ